MIDNLLGLVQQFAGNALNNNPDVPEDKKSSIIESAAAGLLNGFQKEATTTDGLSQILGMLGGGSSNSGISNAFSQNIQSAVISSLMDKVGIKNELAKNIAGQLVPTILGALSNSKGEGINASGLLSSIMGDKASGVDVKGLLDKFAGGDDGKFDLSDAMGMLGKLTGNKSNDNNQSSGGGLGDLLDGLGSLLGGKK